MRPIYLLLFFLLALNCFSQEQSDIKVKHDSIVLIENELAVLYEKSKSALYDISNSEFKIPFQKDYLHYFESGNILISISENGNIREYDWDRGFTDSTEVTTSYFRNHIEEFSEIGCEVVDEDLLVIRDYSYPYYYGVPVLNVHGEDSIDQNGNFVYAEPEPEVFKSGVFNKKRKKWEIKPSHRDVRYIEDHFFVFDGKNEKVERFDWYVREKKGFDLRKSFETANLTIEDRVSILREVFSLNRVQLVNGVNDMYYIHRNGKAGLVQFELMGDLWYFNYKKLSPAKFDFVVYNPQNRALIQYDGDEFHYSTTHFYERDTTINFSTYFQVSEDLFTGEKNYVWGKSHLTYPNQSSLSVELIGRTILVNNSSAQFTEDYPLHTEYGSDSLNENGDLVYPDPIPGVYSSGVFDLEKKEWTILPEHNEVFSIGEGHYLVNDFPLDSNGLIIDSPVIQLIYNGEGERIENLEDYKNSSPVELATAFLPGDTMYYAAYQYMPISLIEDFFFKHDEFLFIAEHNHKMSAYLARIGYENQILSINELTRDPMDLVLPFAPLGHGDFPSPPMFNFIEEDGNYFVDIKHNTSEFKDSSVAVLGIESSGSYEVVYPNGISYFKENIVKLVYKDSSNADMIKTGMILEDGEALKNVSIDTSEYNSLVETFHNPIVFKIIHDEDQVVVKNTPIEYYNNVFLTEISDGYGEISKSTFFQRENNSIWIKDGGQWSKQGKSYASLMNTPYGFIGKTAYVRNKIESYYIEEMELETYDSIQNSLIDQDEKYQLLDSAFTPFKYESTILFSAIEEHPFGYHLFLNPKESIFINVKGELICEDHFDKYYLEDGVLYGENDVVYKIDPEFGDYIFDDQGNPVVLREAEKREIKRR